MRNLRLSVPVLCISLLAGGIVASPQAGPPPKTDDETIIQRGLVAWRTPGGPLKSACAQCHAPDGFDLAIFNFADEHIRRRASMHVELPDADRIVAMVHALRRKYNIAKPLSPFRHRPFQPGGEVLPGRTPADRDLFFGESLRAFLPTLMEGTVDSVASAQKARDELLAVDLFELKIGIPLSRWSEDIFHADESGLISDWIPDLPRYPKPGGAWYKAQDAYINEPSEANLWALYQATPAATTAFSDMPFSALSLDKYRSMLIAQHFMRQKASGKAMGTSTSVFGKLPSGMKPNPMWDIGEYGRTNEVFGEETQGIPPELKGTVTPNMHQRMQELRAPWFWLGWMFDPGLQLTEGPTTTARGHYFAISLWRDGGYPMHNAFMIARKQMSQSFDPNCYLEKPAHVELDYSEFLERNNLIRFEPKVPRHRDMYRKFTANCFRMSLVLFAEDLERTKKLDKARFYRDQVEMIENYLLTVDSSNRTLNEALLGRTKAAMTACGS